MGSCEAYSVPAGKGVAVGLHPAAQGAGAWLTSAARPPTKLLGPQRSKLAPSLLSSKPSPTQDPAHRRACRGGCQTRGGCRRSRPSTAAARPPRPAPPTRAWSGCRTAQRQRSPARGWRGAGEGEGAAAVEPSQAEGGAAGMPARARLLPRGHPRGSQPRTVCQARLAGAVHLDAAQRAQRRLRDVVHLGKPAGAGAEADECLNRSTALRCRRNVIRHCWQARKRGSPAEAVVELQPREAAGRTTG